MSEHDVIDAAVREIAAESSNWFGASYVARLTSSDPTTVSRRLEQLVEAGDLERHFELVSPVTGRTVRTYAIGDEVPVGKLVEADDDREQEFIPSDSDIYVSFSATPSLRAKAVGDAQKKSKRRRSTLSPMSEIRSPRRDFRTS